ncbi:flagellar basal-body MS-ring/collar protein FliF [Candidatus Colwellia aromaticivorans]|uniref:flagellar basal-body MS-ring/collar protein FliF n=1 Tax=Candidatus Colwellia aromaticivorans TaxID=2267621 RepID=UPI003CCC496D
MADTNSMVATDSGEMIASDSGDNGAIEEQKSGFAAKLGNVDILRQLTLVVALSICLAIAVFVIILSNEPDYRFLSKLPTEQLIKTLDILDANQVDYRQENNTISVPTSEYQNIKLLLAREGLSNEPTQGNDILMKDMGFGVSQRMERERLKYGRELQLAKTVEQLQSVSRAKVLLAIPKENIFARREKNPSATVVLTLQRGRLLSAEEVDAVVDIIASAVQGLSPNRVTVTDQNGRLLNSGSQNSISSRSRNEFDLEQKREQEYMDKIDTILIPVVGLGNYTAQVDVMMDFTHTEETARRYNSDLPALRSEMKVEDNTIGGVLGGIPGALSNQPPIKSNIPEDATAGKKRAMPSRKHSESTKNYELDEAISHTKQQGAVVRRVSVSVALDYVNSPSPTPTIDGEAEEGTATVVTKEPRSVTEIAAIRRLLQGSIGFDLQRGDILEVVTIPFTRSDFGAVKEIPIWEQPWFIKILKLVMGAVVIIVLIVAVVRPMLKRLIYPDQTPEDYGDKSLDSHIDLGDETMDMLTSDFDAGNVGFAPDGSLQLPDLHRDEDVLKAVRALVANEPELSSQVVKSWLNEDE